MATENAQPEEIRIPLGLTDIASHSLFLRDPPEELFHYTSLDGARGIIESKALHLTKVAYLNDRSELGFAIRIFREAVDRLLPSINDKKCSSFLTETARQLDSFAQTNICVASFCEDSDLLSQWRSYAGSGKGVALGFSGSILQQVNNSGWAQLLRCVYAPSEQQKITEQLAAILLKSYELVVPSAPIDKQEQLSKNITGFFNTTFLRVAPALKDWHFREEKEWRLVTVPQKVTDSKFRAIVSSSRVSQYYVYEFSPDQNGSYDFLSKIVLGPTDDRELISGALHVLSLRHGVQIRSMGFSQIPYRG